MAKTNPFCMFHPGLVEISAERDGVLGSDIAETFRQEHFW